MYNTIIHTGARGVKWEGSIRHSDVARPTLDDLLRFQSLCRRPHLWPEEVAEARALAKELGVEVVVRHEKLSDWEVGDDSG